VHLLGKKEFFVEYFVKELVVEIDFVPNRNLDDLSNLDYR
jgi:hypothetical protein